MYDGLYSVEKYIKEQNSVLTEFPIIVVKVKSGVHKNRCFHEHNTMELAIITEGNGLHIFNGLEAPVHKGDVLLIPPGIIHAYENGEHPLGVINIIFDGARLPIPPLDGAEIPLFPYFFPFLKHERLEYTVQPIMHIGDEELFQDVVHLCDKLHEELTSVFSGNVLSSLVMFLNIVMLLLRYATPMRNRVKTISFGIGEVLKYIDDPYTEPITLESLAKKSYMSVRSFQIKFKKATGYTVRDYIIRKRISLAKNLLIKGDGHILSVAGTCGFNDLSYFTKTFRKFTRMTPSQFRIKHQNEIS